MEAEPPLMVRNVKAAPAPPWPALFGAAGLDLARFKEVEPMWIPRAHSTEWRAWEGTLPDST